MELERVNKFKEIFTGEKSQNIEAFLERFDTWCGKHGHENDYKTTHFSFLLDGAAYTCYKSLPQEIKDNYQLTRQQFLT